MLLAHVDRSLCLCARIHTRECGVCEYEWQACSWKCACVCAFVMYVYVRAHVRVRRGGRFCVLASACVTYVFVRGILANFYLIPSTIIGARGRCKWKLLLEKVNAPWQTKVSTRICQGKCRYHYLKYRHHKIWISVKN